MEHGVVAIPQVARPSDLLGSVGETHLPKGGAPDVEGFSLFLLQVFDVPPAIVGQLNLQGKYLPRPM